MHCQSLGGADSAAPGNILLNDVDGLHTAVVEGQALRPRLIVQEEHGLEEGREAGAALPWGTFAHLK